MTLPEQLAFYLGGAFVGFIKVTVRQVLSGNASALKGIPQGVGEYAKELAPEETVKSKSPSVGIETD